MVSDTVHFCPGNVAHDDRELPHTQCPSTAAHLGTHGDAFETIEKAILLVPDLKSETARGKRGADEDHVGEGKGD